MILAHDGMVKTARERELKELRITRGSYENAEIFLEMSVRTFHMMYCYQGESRSYRK